MTKLKLGLKWAIILEQDEPFNSNIADVFVLDLFETPASLVKSLKDQGKIVIAYFSAGSYEPWRPDARLYPKKAIGKKMRGWDEYWVNLNIFCLAPGEIDRHRMYLAHIKGFDGVDFDNVDLYQQDSGFNISREDSCHALKMLSFYAHEYDLLCGLKNCSELVPKLVDLFDFSINEQASEYKEQYAYSAFTKLGKPVIEIEYKKPTKPTIDIAKQLKYELLYYPSENLNAKFTRY